MLSIGSPIGSRVRVAVLAGLVWAALPGPAAAQQADPGAPVPLLPPEGGTLDPRLGELEQPAPSMPAGAAGNPSLAPPREIGPPPGGVGTAPAPADSQHLAAPAQPPAPTGNAPTGIAPTTAAPDGQASGAPATTTTGSTDPAQALALGEARAAVAEATETVRELRADSGFKAELNDFLGRARAVLVVPSFFRAGFVVGAAYGSGLLLVRDADGGFSDPAFLTLTAGSLGLQAGAQDARMILLVMTDAGLRAVLRDRFKLEAGASLTFGIVGGGLSTGSTTDVNQDIIAFSHSRGLFGGGALEGAVIEPKPAWNAAYYDTPGITPETIVFDRPVRNPASRPLIESLQAPVPGGG